MGQGQEPVLFDLQLILKGGPVVSTAGGTDSVLGWGTKIPHATQRSCKK